MPYADLEIGLHRWDDSNYAVELRFSQPGSDAETRVGGKNVNLVTFDLAPLRALQLDVAGYGQLLSASLFAGSVKTAFQTAYANAQGSGVPLRLRLFVGDSAPELQNLRWETLRAPDAPDTPLLMEERLFFSRYVSSLSFRPVRPLTQDSLRALVVVANPRNLSSYKPGGRALAALDTAGEQARATAGLAPIEVTALATQGTATLDNLAAHLREGYDILYLCCHGALSQGQPKLWLEDEEGNADVTDGAELVRRINDLDEQPRLVVLASCQSAGDGAESQSRDDGILAALGPRLAEAGVPAVVAMQGNVSLQTIARMMPVFFRELRADGQVDRALAVARGDARERPDHWMPALFMRLKSGRIWYAPGFGGKNAAFSKWPAFLNNLHAERCTPILGPGLLDGLLGSAPALAHKWASFQQVPFIRDHLRDLPQVAQYLAVQQDYAFPRDEMRRFICQEIIRRYGPQLEGNVTEASVDELLAQISRLPQPDPDANPYPLLARLPCPVFITASPDDLLSHALTDAGKEPSVRVCPWKKELDPLNYDLQDFFARYLDDKPAPPSVKKPLVYHLFGRSEAPDSMVFKEDDFFDYAIGATTVKALIPSAVRGALTNKALLFLGFRLDDWSFRVLFRLLMSQQGGARRENYAHVAVQIDPQDSYIVEPELARRFLARYFEKAANINIFWGTMDAFLKELKQQWRNTYLEDLMDG